MVFWAQVGVLASKIRDSVAARGIKNVFMG